MSDSATSIGPLIASTAESLAPERRELYTRFAEKILRGFESHPTGGTSVLATITLEAFEWMEWRAEGELKVRVRNPQDRLGHTVLETLQDDQMFILDTLELALARFDATERMMIHPILHSIRDGEGRLVDLGDANNSESLESYVYIEFVPPIEDAEGRKGLEDHILLVMSWVRDVTRDHRRMIRAVRELNANLEYAGPLIEDGLERTQRVQKFLDWTIDGRFVFVGMRRYAVRQIDGMMEVQIVPDTGLGMWRSDESSRYFAARRGAEIPADIREDLEDPRILLISKSYMESRIQRRGRLDRIVVKEHDDRGRVSGFTIVVGLFTRRVLRTPGSQIPLLSERLRQLIDRLDVTYGSHRHQSIVTAFDSVPVEVLVSSDVDRLADLLQELVSATSSKTVRLVARTHPRGRMLYAAILIPREHYREDLRAEIRQLIEERTGASYIDDRTSFVEEGSAIVHCFCTPAEGEKIRVDLPRLEAELRLLCLPWEDQLLDALRDEYGDRRARELAARYEQAFPEALRVATHPADAVRDVEALEAFATTGRLQFAIWFDRTSAERSLTTLRIYLDKPPLLSDILPAADRFGIRVVDAQLVTVRPADRPEVYVESLRVLPLGADQGDLDAIGPRLAEALGATLSGDVLSDPLNGLVLGAGLDWRQVDLLRAYLEYFVQIQGTLSRPYLRKVLLENPLAVRALVHWLEARHDPSIPNSDRAGREAKPREIFESYRERIEALNEDRALQGFFNLAEATLRTNFFATRSGPHRIVIKLDPSRVRELQGVVPYREIFVHSAELSGIHLRGGPVARGGIRWSDRHDDLRVEILGLMFTQMLKNGLIVPVGAKGGFVLRRSGLSPNEARSAADAQYRVFIASLLDVTDNLSPDGQVIPPEGVRRLDGDDPYLVVAADKGTAHLSDTANEIALGRDFWLGDAFASGGSEGYDHKLYGITARGAWECVKHHFAELGIDPEHDDYSVAGIGDMSGDVFGNGLLLMRRARLLAAFDHRHVFLDPDPDPEDSWQERKRLFELPRSTWDDYSRDVLSKGGGVWPRSAKRIPVPALLAERLGVGDFASGQEIVKSILAMEVDLLWNGGIGTYVKASHESHLDVGDRSNDAVRIDAGRQRARVVGEGGNLGLTQAARVEAGLRGVRLNTDAIDNSAGVDLSDHEVNFKIALAPLVRSGRLGSAERKQLLFDVADAACESVLAHNRDQALSISLDQLRSQVDSEPFVRAIDILSDHVGLSPAELDLPDAAALAERASLGEGLTRPELGVMLGLAKLQALSPLAESEFSDSGYLEPVYQTYFPERFQSEISEVLASHRLRREITALRVVNRLADAGGITLFTSLTTELGVEIPQAASAMLQAEDVLRVPEVREQLLEHVSASRAGVYAALVDLDEGARSVARFLVHIGACDLDRERADHWRTGLGLLQESLTGYLSPGELRRLRARHERLQQQGLPDGLALSIAALPLADRSLNILRIAESSGLDPVSAARAYARLGEESGINWLFERLPQAEVSSLWDRMALIDLRRELLDLHRSVTESVLARGAEDPVGAADAFLLEQAAHIERIRALQQRAATAATPSALRVITSRLHCLLEE